VRPQGRYSGGGERHSRKSDACRAVCTAGAYEVLVEGDSWRVIREREKYEALVRGKTV